MSVDASVLWGQEHTNIEDPCPAIYIHLWNSLGVGWPGRQTFLERLEEWEVAQPHS